MPEQIDLDQHTPEQQSIVPSADKGSNRWKIEPNPNPPVEKEPDLDPKTTRNIFIGIGLTALALAGGIGGLELIKSRNADNNRGMISTPGKPTQPANAPQVVPTDPAKRPEIAKAVPTIDRSSPGVGGKDDGAAMSIEDPIVRKVTIGILNGKTEKDFTPQEIEAYNAYKAKVRNDLLTPVAQSSNQPAPTPFATATPVVTTTEAKPSPTKTLETVKEFNNGIISPKAYKQAKYVTWDIPGNGGTAEGIVINLGQGEVFKLPEDMQVVAIQETLDGKPYGYTIVAISKTGMRMTIIGDVAPSEGINDMGKNFKAGTKIGVSAGSGLSILDGNCTIGIIFSDKEYQKKRFPQQTELPPQHIINKLAVNDFQPPTPTPGPAPVFFDVPAPK